MKNRGRAAAGWYPVSGTDTLRYWDGSRWTRHTRPAGPSVVVNVAIPAETDAATVAQIQALANPETAQALQNLQRLHQAQVLTDAEFQAAKSKLLGNAVGRTRAGWYDDGSGRLRWWDGQQWTDHFHVVGSHPGTPSSHLGWALSPAYTFGLVSFIPALHAALKLQRRELWYWAGALIGGNVVSWILMSVGGSNPDGSSTPVQSLGTSLSLVLAVAGTIQAFRTRDEVFSSTPPAIAAPAEPDPAVAASLAARQRRADASALCLEDPNLARDLRIGRPDLTRQYDDGGLVDVNHVPAAILVSHLGLTAEQASTIVTARDHLGGFTTPDDLSFLAELPPRELDAIRDRVVTL